MDTEQANRIEAKVDRVIAFCDRAEALFGVFMQGKSAKLLSVVAKATGGKKP